MKLTKAIEILTTYLKAFHPETDFDYVQAVKLGREALKQMRTERTIYAFNRHVRMPGETEE